MTQPDEKQRRVMDWIKIMLSFVIGAIATSFTLGAAISRYETTDHAEKTYVRKDVYDSDQKSIKQQLDRMELILTEIKQELPKKQDKKNGGQ
jgi:hypothetical protein